MSESKADSYSCPRCTVGRCHHQTTTFVEIYNGQFLCVPDMPVYICDVCHFAEFELDALESIWTELEMDDLPDDWQPSFRHKRSSPFGD